MIADIALASAWRPRGEYKRFEMLLPEIAGSYAAGVITFPPDVDMETVRAIEEVLHACPLTGNWMIRVTPEWSWGRYLALAESLNFTTNFIHYVDFDRLLRWVETQPGEWRNLLREIEKWDCLIAGRTTEDYATHPQALIWSEKLSNMIVSYLLGMNVDASAGSKGFSRRAVEYLVANTRPGHALGTDAEWPVLLRRAGFRIGYQSVKGLDWESADRYQKTAADTVAQRKAVQIYDENPAHWRYRMGVAAEIVQSGLDAAKKQLTQTESCLFDTDAVFEANDYFYHYGDDLTPERSEQEVRFLMQILDQRPSQTMLDLACGFGRHSNLLAAMGHRVIGVDRSQDFLEIARRNALAGEVTVSYQQGDMRQIDFENQFDCVLLLFTSFGYFEDFENDLVLQKIARALKPSGKVVLDIQNRDRFVETMVPFIVTEKDGNLMVDRITYDEASRRMYNRRIMIRDGMRRDKPFFIRLYNLDEISYSLQIAGMTITQVFGGWDGSPATRDSSRLIILAQKPGQALFMENSND